MAAFLFLAVFISQFLRMSGFGLYEDDYVAARYINADANLSSAIISGIHDHARPVGRFVRYALTFLGAELGGLLGMYILAYLIICLNVFLTYVILKPIAPRSSCVGHQAG